ncbi:MAG: ATP-binding cassette domain-containing protein [Spirochaetaceae bacterium]|nr:MAG: ATP-binding cassette domain-containing protein [Spirochaetaceae bacterium]
MSQTQTPLPAESGTRPVDPTNLLEIRGLRKHFPIVRGLFSSVKGLNRAVDDVTIFVRKGETLGLVGESGCGKTTAGRCIVRGYTVTEGEIAYRRADGKTVDLAQLSENGVRPYRREIRMIFQDPYSSLNPRMTVFDVISEVLRVNRMCTVTEMKDRVAALLERVGLRNEYMQRYPHAFSGGERQRIVIARALITDPRLVVCDEAVSALDVSIRGQILNLLEEIQDEFDLTYVFISHDLSVIRHVCDRIVVMYVGKAVEVAPALEMFIKPLHPYTEALLAAVPIPDPRVRESRPRVALKGEVADSSNPPSGCYFHPRCPYAEKQCRNETPPLREVDGGRYVACHFAESLNLRGALER